MSTIQNNVGIRQILIYIPNGVISIPRLTVHIHVRKFSKWRPEPILNTKLSVFADRPGCWGFQDEDLGQCDLSTCVSHDRPRSRTSTHNNSQFCCCRGNRCNENVTQGQYVALAPKAMHPMAGRWRCGLQTRQNCYYMAR